MNKLYPIKMTKRKLNFLLTAFDGIDDRQLRGMLTVKILSRLSALGFWGLSKEKLN